MTILIFDSGIGGLSILREARAVIPDHQFVYAADEEGFPYGDREESTLAERIESIFEKLIATYQPELAIVACNTASTIILPRLRSRFDIDIVGTVPAIKPAAERTRTGMISVLGTPGTIHRPYLHALIRQHAAHCSVELVGSARLAQMAEDYLQQQTVDYTALSQEIAPCFKQSSRSSTDIVILGCTHYPFLANQMRKIAPWPVDWLDPAEAIAQRALSLVGKKPSNPQNPDCAVTTNAELSAARKTLLHNFGLRTVNRLQLESATTSFA